MSEKKEKKIRGDRRDGRLVREAEPMHKFMGYLIGERVENEAVLNETLDMTAIDEYVAEKNASNPSFKYTMFHVICAAIGKIFLLRPKLNYFYIGNRMYERKFISLAFVVKRQFTDSSDEALAIIKLDKNSDISPVEQIHGKVEQFVTKVRKKGETDGTNDIIAKLVCFPKPIIKLISNTLHSMDAHDTLPNDLIEFDPYHASIFISNIGSIKLSAQYHHLSNWGTNSFFVLMNQKKLIPFYKDDGTYEMRQGLELGITIDERIADGTYFANSLKVLRKLINNPKLLDLPLETPVELD